MVKSNIKIKKSIEKIYKTLDEVSPLDYDCGKLCNEICCTYDDEDKDGKVGLYLIPGEELMYANSEEFELYTLNPDEIDYPHSWKNKIYLVNCINPPRCNRKIRPIQCRTFPLIPHISKDGSFHMIIDPDDIPYKCPIIEENIKLNNDFIETTLEVWKKLIKNPLIYDLVDLDSRRRINRKENYTVII